MICWSSNLMADMFEFGHNFAGPGGAFHRKAGRAHSMPALAFFPRAMDFRARTRPSLRVRLALMPWRIHTSSRASFLSNNSLARSSACSFCSR